MGLYIDDIDNINIDDINKIFNLNDLDNLILDPSYTFITEYFEGGYHEQITYNTNITNNINTITTIYKTLKNQIYTQNHIQDKGVKNKKKINTLSSFEFPFVLDPFQYRAILCIEGHESVLVSAHTSAGKTAVAIYAIAMAKKNKQKVIYTSPIKALSNQKYRDLQGFFGDVGLMTGDVTKNERASCLVMTTEILRNMLFKGSELTKEIAWVIFDEVHYMRDKERGVVWEECIILLPNSIKFVFLSATIPNAKEFGMWISKIKNQPCNVIYTNFRPVPLKHYICPEGGINTSSSSSSSKTKEQQTLYMVMESGKNFLKDNFLLCVQSLRNSVGLIDNVKYKKGEFNRVKNSKIVLSKLIQEIYNKEWCPVICFAFSKRECEDLALNLIKLKTSSPSESKYKLDLTTQEEKNKINIVFNNAISILSEKDQELPQIRNFLQFLEKGIGIHHGGMLPLLKECVELLFQEGLIKVLFSTETFGMGINMPARSVIFTSIKKFDGENQRMLKPGEFIQMSGRAGRRNKDKVGNVIVMLNSYINEEECANLIKGESERLISSFQISYNQLSNLLRIEGLSATHILKQSFRQFQNERVIPVLNIKLMLKYKEYSDIKFNTEEQYNLLKEIVNLRKSLKENNESLRKKLMVDEIAGKFLVPGRIIKIKDFGYATTLNYIPEKSIQITNNKEKKENKYINQIVGKMNTKKEDEKSSPPTISSPHILDVLVNVRNFVDSGLKFIPGQFSEDSTFKTMAITLDSVEEISIVRGKIPKDFKSIKTVNEYGNMFFEIIVNRFKFKVPKLDLISELGIQDKEILNLEESVKLGEKYIELKKKEYRNKFNEICVESLITKCEQKQEKLREIEEIIKTINSHRSLVLEADLNNMQRVMRRLDYLTKDNVLSHKGQAVCEISGADELLTTELLFNNFFNDLEPELIASAVSCCLSGESKEHKLNEKALELLELKEYKPIKTMYKDILKYATNIVNVLIESKVINIDYTDNEEENKKLISRAVSDYLTSISVEFMIPLFLWAKGEEFYDVLDKMDGTLYEGSFIRVIRRVEEFLKSFEDCAVVIGNQGLRERVGEVLKKIRRGLPFAASLYLAD